VVDGARVVRRPSVGGRRGTAAIALGAMAAVLSWSVSGCALPSAGSTGAPPSATVAGAGRGVDDGLVAATVPRLAELVQVWNGARGALRQRLVESLSEAGADVVEGGRGLRADSGLAPRMALVVRLGDVPACSDPEAGVVVGEAPRVLGCGAQDLAGLALFLTTMAALPATPVTLVVGEDDDDIAALLPASVVTVWVATGVFRAGLEADVLDVAVVDARWLDLSLRVTQPSLDHAVRAAARAAAWSPPPRLLGLVAQRLERAPPTGRWPLLPLDPRALARDPATRDLVVDRCSVVDVEPARARLRCRSLPGRAIEDVVDDIVRAIDDSSIGVGVERAEQTVATSWTHPLVQALQARVVADSPRAVVVPALHDGDRASACAPLRRRGLACIGAAPVLAHPERIARRGRLDDSVEVAALERAAREVIDVVDAVARGQADAR
jgi:hypothetical protein